jgi:hypothetical protein
MLLFCFLAQHYAVRSLMIIWFSCSDEEFKKIYLGYGSLLEIMGWLTIYTLYVSMCRLIYLFICALGVKHRACASRQALYHLSHALNSYFYFVSKVVDSYSFQRLVGSILFIFSFQDCNHMNIRLEPASRMYSQYNYTETCTQNILHLKFNSLWS